MHNPIEKAKVNNNGFNFVQLSVDLEEVFRDSLDAGKSQTVGYFPGDILPNK